MPLAYFGDNYMTYDEFLKQKSIVDVATGMTEIPELNPMMFDYQRDIVTWALKRGRACIFADCGMGKTLMELELGKHVEGNTILFSPPFASLYTYSNSEHDMGNVKDEEEFLQMFDYLVEQLARVLKAGRNISIHCMNLPTSKTRDGYIGIKDFRGDLIRAFQKHGFIYHSEVVIWKDPVIAMQRTKALGLLHKQLVKDSAMSRQGIPDYLVTMKKAGENAEPIAGELDHYAGDEDFKSTGRLSIDLWQRYASPVWMDINPSDTLQYASARDEKDERHICPLQLSVIHRALQLWSNPDDVVLSPFGGIGSEGYESLKCGRKYIGIELKESYYNQAVRNLQNIELELKNDAKNGSLFGDEI